MGRFVTDIVGAALAVVMADAIAIPSTVVTLPSFIVPLSSV
jgi:hypothetical protein